MHRLEVTGDGTSVSYPLLGAVETILGVFSSYVYSDDSMVTTK